MYGVSHTRIGQMKPAQWYSRPRSLYCNRNEGLGSSIVHYSKGNEESIINSKKGEDRRDGNYTINAKRFPTTSSQPFAIQIKMHKSLDGRFDGRRCKVENVERIRRMCVNSAEREREEADDDRRGRMYIIVEELYKT